jgi:beta-lactamase class A
MSKIEKVKCVHCGRLGAHAPKCILNKLDRLARDPEVSAWLVEMAVRESFEARPFDKDVETFAFWMKRQLRANAHKGGWKELAPADLMKRLRHEVEELAEVLQKMRTRTGMSLDVVHEAVDVANFCFMIADQACSRRWH